MKNSVDHSLIRVFLIDDHRSVLWGLQRLIETARDTMYVVGIATSWKEASSVIENVYPDVVLLDLDLGKEKGLQIIPHIQAKTKARILILTGLRDANTHDAAIVAGARGVVEKEDAAENILLAIRKVYKGQLWLPTLVIDRLLSELSRPDMVQQSDPNQIKIASLTTRERDIVAAIASNAGASSKIIARSLHISEHTLRNHISSIYEKLGVATRLELFAFAHQNGLTEVRIGNPPEK